jgi:hypothetical protein
MTNTLVRVEPFDPTTELANTAYSAVVVACGYEPRARYLAETFKPEATVRIALAFNQQQELDYAANVKVLTGLGFEVVQLSDRDFQKGWNDRLALILASSEKQKVCRILCDVSSLSRFRIAGLVNGIRIAHSDVNIVVDFTYSLAQFIEPAEETTSVHEYIGPVLPDFAGWSSTPEQAPTVAVGLGYEEDRALGALEYVQASDVFIFVPTSSIPEYLERVQVANEVLLDEVPAERQIRYNVERPHDLFMQLEELTALKLERGNVVIFPFGPKLFSLCSSLIAWRHRFASIWRLSRGVGEAAVARRASQTLIGLRIHATPQVDTSISD